MKKAVAAIILLIYFTVSSGFTVNLHYCMNRFDSLEWGSRTSETCGKCGMESGKSNGCCHNELKVIKLQEDQTPAQLTTYHFETPAQLPPPFFTLPLLQTTPPSLPLEKAHAPPKLHGQDTYLRNCVFRL